MPSATISVGSAVFSTSRRTANDSSPDSVAVDPNLDLCIGEMGVSGWM